MSLILSGTDGLSDVDGSAATPAIRGADANTGIFFGTDIIGFSEGGVEAMRINASGNVVMTGTLTTAAQSIAKASLPAGSVLQVVQSYTATGTTTTSGSPVDTALSASITPTSASSKILVLMNGNGYTSRQTSISYGDMYFYIVRGSTQLTSSRSAINFNYNTWTDFFPAQNSFVYLDSPATTSATTYKMQISISNSQSLTVPFQSFLTMTLLEIAA